MRLNSRHLTGARVCAILLVLVQLVYVISRFSSVTCKIWPFRRVSFTKNETNIHEQFSHVFYISLKHYTIHFKGTRITVTTMRQLQVTFDSINYFFLYYQQTNDVNCP
jgi:hypothetical protein